MRENHFHNKSYLELISEIITEMNHKFSELIVKFSPEMEYIHPECIVKNVFSNILAHQVVFTCLSIEGTENFNKKEYGLSFIEKICNQAVVVFLESLKTEDENAYLEFLFSKGKLND